MPERTTEYEYDEQGRLVRSTEWVESAWDEDQRAWMLALAEYEADLCTECGSPKSVCQDPDSDRRNPRAKWIYWPKSLGECHVTTAGRLFKQKEDDGRALIRGVIRVRRGSPKPPQ